MRKAVMGLVAAVFVGVAAMGLYLTLQKPDQPLSPAMVNADVSTIGGPFTLTDQTGKRVTSAELIKGPTLIYFGYTFCPDVCPVDVTVMADAVDLLAEKGLDVTPIFITVDPARDDPESMASYVEAMHPKMVGLTGTEAEIKQAADAYKVYYQRVNTPESQAGYLMNHTSFTYFVTPDGVKAVFRDGFPPEEMAGAIARMLNR